MTIKKRCKNAAGNNKHEGEFDKKHEKSYISLNCQ